MIDELEVGSPVEPVLGPVRMVRTFEIGDDGALLGVTCGPSTPAWQDGDNTARCLVAHHPAPAAGCTCGFYAYDHPGWVEYGEQHNVLAVVECHGRTVLGVKGVRAEHMRIVALWLGKRVPPWLAARVEARYPSAVRFGSRRQMLAAFPPTPLPSQRRPCRLLDWRVAVGLWLTQIAAIGVAGLTVALSDQPLSRQVSVRLLVAVCLPGAAVALGYGMAGMVRRSRVPHTAAWAGWRLAVAVVCAAATVVLLSAETGEAARNIEVVGAAALTVELTLHLLVSARDKSGRWAAFAPVQRLEREARRQRASAGGGPVHVGPA